MKRSYILTSWRSLAALVVALAATSSVHAAVKLPNVLSSHMVLQREMPVPIWGTAAPDEEVTVTFRDQKKTAKADKDGKWSVKLDALKAGGPDELVVKGTNEVKLEDVLVGEVWVGSGQSNMGGTVSNYAGNDPVLASLLAAAPYPKVRLLGIGNSWREADAKGVPGSSALLFSFGVRLQKELGVPVGLMQGAVGGTPSGYWLSPEALAADAACQDLIKKYAEQLPELEKSYQKAMVKWEADMKAFEAQQATAKDAPAPEKKDPKAAATAAPRPPQQPARPDKAGEAIGAPTGHLYARLIKPAIPFAIRGVLWDQGESGTKVAGVDQYTLMGALIRGWRSEWGQDFAFVYVQKPSGGGPAWDPSNSVTNRSEKFVLQPVQVVQNLGAYVENHVAIMKYPNTYMVTSTDLGSGIHPSNKSGYGHRASDVALGAVYGQKVPYIGPMYDNHKIDGNQVKVTFKNAESGLAVKHSDKLQGFLIAGEDKVFYWADAKIDGDAVVLSSDKVAKPVAVRYAYSFSHPWANLFNKDGLPALTFRTDTW